MAARPRSKDNPKKTPRKKVSVLVQERIDYVDYKNVALLERCVTDRSKIRARLVSGNDTQQQREIARAVKNAREMALLPYTKRVSTVARGGRGERADRGDRGRPVEAAAAEPPVDKPETQEAE